MTGNGRHRILTRIAALAICNLTLLALTAVPSAAPAVWGTSTEVGDITGVLPLCECGSPLEQATWSPVKSLYR